MAHVAWWLLAVAWVAQFVAWRREVIMRQQLELVAERLERLQRLANHPAYQEEQFARWVRAESR